MVRLTRARPFKVVSAWLTTTPAASGRRPSGLGFARRHAQHHLFVVEGDHIEFQGIAGHLLGLDAHHDAHAVRGIDDVIADREIQNALVH